ncbi:MAG: DUF2330 domain-containing protein [Hyphomicrobiaceae bacterium]|nr:DUF2330 domain-containing protein [Hyphomicrobiaceae bacterium]
MFSTTFRRTLAAGALALAAAMVQASPLEAFCGFYVAKADAKLFNKASKVVVARHGERTAVTMASDYQGDPKEFGLVIPVPTVVTRDQIKVVDNATVDHLDAYTAPRLVEYRDPDPCRRPEVAAFDGRLTMRMQAAGPAPAARERAKALGVKIEAEYTVGEYDIVLLSATQSDGLATWLTESGYKIPEGAATVLGSYIKQGMRFFLAKVNLQEQAKSGATYLRPIQVTYETPKFMLPIRLGTVNAGGPQDMIVLMLTEKGRVETTNYRTVRIPSNVEIPTYTKTDFGKVYTAMFDAQVKKDDMRLVYLEYAWDMGWCDPCAADPVPNDKLVSLGATWIKTADATPSSPQPGGPQLRRLPPGGSNVFATRLHVRYDAKNFPEDLAFQETADRQNFQGRYILRHPFTGDATCPAGEDYRRSLSVRFDREAAALANLTGWDMADIKRRMAEGGQKAP